jgi:hypothetical protein
MCKSKRTAEREKSRGGTGERLPHTGCMRKGSREQDRGIQDIHAFENQLLPTPHTLKTLIKTKTLDAQRHKRDTQRTEP